MNRVELLNEITEVQKDLDAFKQAYDVVNARTVQRQDQGDGDITHFTEWPGTVATMNVLIMCITRCEGLIEDMRKNLDQLPHGLAPVEDRNHEHANQ